MNIRKIILCLLVVATIAVVTITCTVKQDPSTKAAPQKPKAAESPRNQSKHHRDADTLASKPPLKPKSANHVGYVPLRISKGKKTFSGLPFLKESTMNFRTLGDLRRDAAKGDVASWNDGNKELRYEYDGEHWHDPQGKPADDVRFDFGKYVLTYERTEDVSTEIVFTGELDMEAATRIK